LVASTSTNFNVRVLANVPYGSATDRTVSKDAYMQHVSFAFLLFTRPLYLKTKKEFETYVRFY